VDGGVDCLQTTNGGSIDKKVRGGRESGKRRSPSRRNSTKTGAGGERERKNLAGFPPLFVEPREGWEASEAGRNHH